MTWLLVSFYLPHRKDAVLNEATAKDFGILPVALSFTLDNGNEFSHHKELSTKTDTSVCFCEPYSPWQRGTNENMNGLLRQFFPKGSSLADAPDEIVEKVVTLLTIIHENGLASKLLWRCVKGFLISFSLRLTIYQQYFICLRTSYYTLTVVNFPDKICHPCILVKVLFLYQDPSCNQ